MKKLLSLAVAVSLLGAVTGHIYAGKNHDDVPGHECEQGEHAHNPHCEPSETPSLSVTPTPSPTETCTLVLDGEFQVCAEVSVTPTVTEAPSATPTPPTCAEDEHLNNAGTECLKFQYGGSPDSTWTQADYDKNFPGEDKFHGLAK